MGAGADVRLEVSKPTLDEIKMALARVAPEAMTTMADGSVIVSGVAFATSPEVPPEQEKLPL